VKGFGTDKQPKRDLGKEKKKEKKINENSKKKACEALIRISTEKRKKRVGTEWRVIRKNKKSKEREGTWGKEAR